MQSHSEALPRVEVVPYDPYWPVLYQAEQQLVRACLSSLVRDIEHIGSTAVPKLKAKPIIDMMAAVENVQDVQLMTAKLRALGYVLIQTGMRNRLLFRRTAKPGGQMFHLHVVGLETWNGRKERIMRDYLVSHPTAAAAYGSLKEKLAASYAEDSIAYTKAKTDFLQSIMDNACDDLGLARINVWDD